MQQQKFDMRKFLKQYYKERYVANSIKRVELEGIINQWVRYADKYGDSRTHVWIFEGTDVDKVTEQLDKVTYLEGYSNNSAHDCSGQWFSDAVEIKVCAEANRVYAWQYWRRDV